MALSLANIKPGGTRKPPRLLIYGPNKVGKTTLGATAPSPIFIRTEDGLDTLQVAAFEFPREGAPDSPVANSFAEVIEAMGTLYQEEHPYKTAVFDSLDWMETLIHADICRENNVKNIEEIPYGKGYVFALAKWRQYIDGINLLRDDRGMAIIQIAHALVKRYDAPDTEPYDRYKIKLHDKAAALIMEHADAILFAQFRTTTVTDTTGFGQKRKRGVGSGERIMYTEERPAFIAGNRYTLPPILPLDWKALETAMAATDVPSTGAHPVANLAEPANEEGENNAAAA